MATKVITKCYWDFTFVSTDIEGCWYHYKDYVEECKDSLITPIPLIDMGCKLLEYDYFKSSKRTKAQLQNMCCEIYHLHDSTDLNTTTYITSGCMTFNFKDLEIKGKELKNILKNPNIKIRKFDHKKTIISKIKISGTDSQ